MLRRQFTKTFLRLIANKPFYLPQVPSFYFNTAPPGKKILDVWDLNRALYVELSDALAGAYTCKQIAEILKENLHQMSDYQLSYALFRIYNDDIELDEHFTNVILPIVKEFVKNFDRNHNKALYEIIQLCGWLKVRDEGLWQLFEEKLLTQRLYRYIPTKELCKVAHAMSEVGAGSKELFNSFEKVIIQQRLNLLPEDLHYAKQAFENRKFGSQVLFGVFEDNTKQISGGQPKEQAKLHQYINYV